MILLINNSGAEFNVNHRDNQQTIVVALFATYAGILTIQKDARVWKLNEKSSKCVEKNWTKIRKHVQWKKDFLLFLRHLI